MRDCSAIYLSTSHLRPTPYCNHRFVCSHSSRTSRRKSKGVDILLEILLVWDKSLGRAWRSLTFYPLRLMHRTGQGDSSTLWHFTVEPFAKRSTKQVRGTLLPSDTLRLSCLLSGVPNRSGGLFYPLTLLRFNSKQSTKQVKKDYSTLRHFYGLTCYAKHQTGQEKLFYSLTLLRFSCLLCKTLNRLRKTLLTLYGWAFTFSSKW